MHLDPRQYRIDRRGLHIEQPDRRGSDQHQLAGDAGGLDRARQNITGRHVTRRIMAGEMDPELAVAVGWDLESRNGDGADSGGIGLDRQRARAGANPQHLETQRRHNLVVRQHHHRNTPYDAVAFRLDSEQAPPRRGAFQHGDIRQQAWKTHQKRPRIATDGCDAERAQTGAGLLGGSGQTGFTEDDTRLADGVRQHLIVARQGPQLLPGGVVKIAIGLRGHARRHPVGFGKHDIESDDNRAKPGQPRHQIGYHRARPRPLPHGLQAFFVDIGDDDRPLLGLARPDQLVQVESPQPQLFKRGRVRHAQRRQRQQQRKAQCARYPKSPRYALEPSHADWPRIVRRELCHFSRNARIN